MLQRANQPGFLPLFLIGACLAVLSPLFWLATRLPADPLPRTYDNLGLYEQVLPGAHYTAERLRAGEWPLWNPWQLCGTEHLADPSQGVFQPLGLLFLVLPVPTALAAHGFLAVLLMGINFCLCLRAMGARYAPSLFGAVVYAFSGAAAAGLSYPALAALLAWMPLCFWGVRAVAAQQRNAVPLLGVALALTGLSGAAGPFFATVLGLSAYAIACLSRARRTAGIRWSAGLRGIRNAVLLSLGLGAVQLLPAIAWAWPRGAWLAPGPAALQAALPASMRELVQQLFAVPSDNLLPPLLYFGTITLLVLPAALFHRAARAEVLAFLPLAALAALLALYGRAGWDARLPFEAFAFPASFAVAVLAALGADRLFETGRDPRSPNVWVPLLVTVLCGAALFLLLPSAGRGTALVFLTVSLLPSVVVRLRWLAAACTGAAILLLFIDLSYHLRQRTIHPYADMPGMLARFDPSLRVLQEQTVNGRAAAALRPIDTLLPVNFGALREIRCAGGHAFHLTPRQQAWWARLGNGALGDTAAPAGSAAQPRLLNVMAVRALLAAPDSPLVAAPWPETGPRLRPAISDGPLKVLVNDDALPRAYWTGAWRRADAIESTLTQLDAADFRPGMMCVVEADEGTLGALSKTVPETSGQIHPMVTATLAVDRPEHVELRVTAPAPGITVLSDTFARGWRAEIDGKPAPILRVNGLFRGVETPAGEHTIVFQYVPVEFYAGLAISMITAALMALFGLVRAFQRPA